MIKTTVGNCWMRLSKKRNNNNSIILRRILFFHFGNKLNFPGCDFQPKNNNNNIILRRIHIFDSGVELDSSGCSSQRGAEILDLTRFEFVEFVGLDGVLRVLAQSEKDNANYSDVGAYVRDSASQGAQVAMIYSLFGGGERLLHPLLLAANQLDFLVQFPLNLVEFAVGVVSTISPLDTFQSRLQG